MQSTHVGDLPQPLHDERVVQDHLARHVAEDAAGDAG